MDQLGPIFTHLGWTLLDPQGDSFAGLWQSRIGNVPPRSIFAIIQSAQMNGYGVDIINNLMKKLYERLTLIDRSKPTSTMYGPAKAFVIVASAANRTFEYAKENPKTVAAMGAGLVMVAAPVVVAPGAFATLQSAGAGGYGVVVVGGVVQGTGAVVGATGVKSFFFGGEDEAKSEDADNTKDAGMIKLFKASIESQSGLSFPFSSLFTLQNITFSISATRTKALVSTRTDRRIHTMLSIEAHPYLAIVAGLVLLCLGIPMTFRPYQTATSLLGRLGFKRGVVAGSFASYIHSLIGKVGANSLFEPQGGEEVTVSTGDETNDVETATTIVASNTQSNQADGRFTSYENVAYARRQERKFKKLCYKFRDDGYCLHGSFCRFVHISAPKGTGAQSTEHPMDVYFAKYPKFDHKLNKPFFEEFDRMCSHFGWDDDKASEPWHLFRIAFTQEFNYVYGDDENDLLLWQKMFKIIGLAEPTTLGEARQTMRVTRVNLVDMTETPRTGVPVQRFDTVDLLRQYSYAEDKRFPKALAYTGGMLKMLLREFDNQYDGRRLGGSERKATW
ncbi:hypothetical protein FSARC_3065 [Fusarium sarcochroum]|uniref:C3H1-type domain-containing protein n=1 Tax=Fusarium sarcochroum TaxID=1208366 RepID=A0A8H4U5C7_9HYPO|nr:hypothetical protein FSARC_3065 [Fusarium sarcochroum]